MISEKRIQKIEKKLENIETRLSKLEKILTQDKKQFKRDIPMQLQECLNKLSRKAGISKDQLKNIYHFDEKTIIPLTKAKGTTLKETQFKNTLAILTVYHFCYGKDSIRSQQLRKMLERIEIGSLTNLGKNLLSYKKYLIGEGKTRSPDFTYKITHPGIQKGIKIIKEMETEKKQEKDN